MITVLAACGGPNKANIPEYDDPLINQNRVGGELAFSSPSLMKMGESFRIAGDYTSALRVFQRAAVENEAHVPSRLALGQIYQRLGASDGAITYYRQVLDIEPDNTDAQLGIGQMMVMSNQPLEAVSYLEQVAEKSPNNYKIYNSIGLAYDLQGLHEDAQIAYGQGLSIRPDQISLLNNLALSFAIDGEYAPSIQLLSKAVNLDFSQTTAQQNLIMVYALSGEEEEARTIGKSFLTPIELEEDLEHYKWLKTLTSKRRAQAIFLNLTSFPDEEEADVISPNVNAVKRQSVVSLDPKKKMLDDILNEEQNEETEVSNQDSMPFLAGNYHIELGSYSSLDEVIKNWENFKEVAPDLLSSEKLNIEEVVTADNQEIYRLNIGKYDNRNAAIELCVALKVINISCNVMNSDE